MAKRFLKRRNYFLNILKQQTFQYITAETKELKQKLRKIVVDTKNIVSQKLKRPFSQLKKGGVVTYYYKGKETKEGDSNFGKVLANQNTIVDRTLNVEQSIVDKYTQLMFAESQRLVPIDKRYNFANMADMSGGRAVYIKSYRRRTILDISGMDSVLEMQNKYSARGLRNFRRLATEKHSLNQYLGGTTKQYETLELGSGWYIGEQADFIRKYLDGTNNRGTYNLYYDRAKNQIYERSGFAKLEFTPVTGVSLNMKGEQKTINVKGQPTGGFQELKSGGKIEKTTDGYRIIYSAFDKTKPVGDRYNYAALQHDNLAFKHKFGESMYLSKAVMKYKSKLYEEHRKSVIKSIKGS